MKHTDLLKPERKKDIAIIGMSGRFPRSENLQAFWNNLIAGKELVRTYEERELRAMGADEKLIGNPNYIWASSLLDDPESFDYAFFGYTRNEAAIMDPQTRLMHEQAWLALEDAGCNPDEYKGKIGLYLSASDNLNWRAHTILNPDDQISSFMATRLADKSFISTIVSYNLDLKGPSYYTDTACSSSLTAIHFACRSLLMKECSVALAGASSIITTEDKGYWYEDGMVFSKDGHCRAFDKDASGTFFGEGVAVVVLKRFEDAVNDGDHVYAVIRATAVNNDGRRKVGYTAPSVSGQAECISLAHKVAGIAPDTVSYIEAHGTGTTLGDPIEIEALNKAFQYNKAHKCAIGSVKSNLGHLDAVSGVVGVIKTALSLKYRQLPPSINYTAPNPEINFSAGPFYVNNRLQPWLAVNGQPLRAGVSSFGIGGTNAHAVMEEAPEMESGKGSKQPALLVFSAKTPAALSNYRESLVSFLQDHTTVDPVQLSYTLQTGRKHFKYRDFLVYEGDAPTSDTGLSISAQQGQRTAFMFSGGGSQYYKMAEQLYVQEPYFRDWMDKGFAVLERKTGVDYRLITGYTAGGDNTRINDIRYMLPVLFLVEYAVAQLLIKNGVKPDYMIGHSLGEYVAACISGVFSFEDGLDIIVKRAELTTRVPEGGMIGVEASAVQIRPYLTAALSVAAINAPESCVIAGPKEALRPFTAALTAAGISFTELKISIAAHSSMFDAILDDFLQVFDGVQLAAPQIPFISNLTGQEITAEEATSPAYWVRHLRQTVNFVSGIGCLLEKGISNYIEIGSGGILTSFLKQHTLFSQDSLAINILRHPKEEVDDYVYYLKVIGRLWQRNVAIDWAAFHNGQQFRKIPAPGYVFDKTALKVRVDPFRQMVAGGNLLPGKSGLHDSLYNANWKQSLLVNANSTVFAGTCLVFAEEGWRLSDKDILITRGATYAQNAKGYVINPFEQADYESLFRSLEQQGVQIEQVVYNWQIPADNDVLRPSLPLILLCQQLIVNQAQNLRKLTFLADFGYKVVGNETINIPQQLAGKTAEMIIVNNSTAVYHYLDTGSESMDVGSLQLELTGDLADKRVAYRYGNRWTGFHEQVRIEPSFSNDVVKPNANYLIINGAGATGHAITAYLQSQYDVNLIIAGMAPPATVGGISYYPVDVSDVSAFDDVLQQIRSVHGEIAGMIYTATEQAIADVSDLDKLMAAQADKLRAIDNLYTLFKDTALDFVWIAGRLSSELAFINENIFADTYARLLIEQHTKELPRWTVVNVDDLHNAGSFEKEVAGVFELSAGGSWKQLTVAYEGMDPKKKKPAAQSAQAVAGHDIVTAGYVAPQTSTEIFLCELWQSFLGRDKAGVEDGFFEMGGNSLKAMTILKRIQQQYDVQLTLKDFYAKPTVKLMAEEIDIAALIRVQKSKKESRIIKI
ncbi:type I polyketide synthase [Chitinophaga rhizophila]|uniref:Acyltransferase domain-containing protein n=1 Tax=Chitinophaga rhizophila TaxID=2866212 RepID=A0ABS7GL44_9BACT|nr:type I polyketide synthase [Chitinophaga rhizophila]MBW8687178.1 acyltransferase domain-containing protein [Chitinophaga rhizophila]